MTITLLAILLLFGVTIMLAAPAASVWVGILIARVSPRAGLRRYGNSIAWASALAGPGPPRPLLIACGTGRAFVTPLAWSCASGSRRWDLLRFPNGACVGTRPEYPRTL